MESRLFHYFHNKKVKNKHKYNTEISTINAKLGNVFPPSYEDLIKIKNIIIKETRNYDRFYEFLLYFLKRRKDGPHSSNHLIDCFIGCSKLNHSLDDPLKNITNFELEGHYINLNRSIERKEKINTYDFKIKLNRFEAIEHDNGDIGCAMSHISLLNTLLEKKKENTYYLIMEDDMKIHNKKKYEELFINLSNVIRYQGPDVIILAGTKRIISSNKNYGFGFYKLLKSNTTCCYIVKSSFIPRLIEKFSLGLSMLHTCKSGNKTNLTPGEINEKATEETDNVEQVNVNNRINEVIKNEYCIDQIWNNNIINENWVTYIEGGIIFPDLEIDSVIFNKTYMDKEDIEDKDLSGKIVRDREENIKHKNQYRKYLNVCFNKISLFNNNLYNLLPLLQYHKIYDEYEELLNILHNDYHIKLTI